MISLETIRYAQKLARSKIIVDEGLNLKPYKDSLGVLTIGYGINLDEGITKDEADMLLSMRLESAFQDVCKLFDIKYLTPVRIAVLVNMSYNLGYNRLKTFKKMAKAIKEKNWEQASEEMLSSEWAKQVGKRATRLAELMYLG